MADDGGSGEGNTVADDLGLWYLSDVTPIGRGGFAYVYAATDTRFDRRVAVKVFQRMLTDDDRALFEIECRTTGRLSGVANIITVHDVDYTADGRPCIVMAHVAGGSLGDHLRRQGRIPWRRAVAWLVPLLRALDTAHGHGVLHRDIKPENILVDGDRVFLTDFGLATLKAGAAEADEAGVFASPLHAAPETFAGATRDERSDVYSAASTLYNLIAGYAPFQGHGADLSPEAIVNRLRHEPPAHLPAELAPADLDAVVQRALAKDPARRPASAAELADAIEAVLDAHSSPVPTPAHETEAEAAPAPAVPAPRAALTQTAPTPVPAADPPRRRFPWLRRFR
ncbi:MAG: serine/threonine-protein kinase [Acidimicrobiales bacterium]